MTGELVPIAEFFATKPILYRLYDASRRLLYVGATMLPITIRLAAHQRNQPWGSQVAFARLEERSDVEDLARAERLAIGSEGPKHNHRNRPAQLGLRISLPPSPHDRPSSITKSIWVPLDPPPTRDELRYELNIRGVSIDTFAAKAGISGHTVRRSLHGGTISDHSAVAIKEALAAIPINPGMARLALPAQPS